MDLERVRGQWKKRSAWPGLCSYHQMIGAKFLKRSQNAENIIFLSALSTFLIFYNFFKLSLSLIEINSYMYALKVQIRCHIFEMKNCPDWHFNKLPKIHVSLN